MADSPVGIKSFTQVNNKVGALVTASAGIQSLANIAMVSPNQKGAHYTKGYTPQPNASDNLLSSFVDLEPLPALLFNYEGENKIALSSDITDHYAEDNTVLIDQIGLKPEMVTVTGYIGELSSVIPAAFQFLQSISNTLGALNVYAPKQSPKAQALYNDALTGYNQASAVADVAISALSAIGGDEAEVGDASGVYTVGASSVQNKQQTMFQQFYGYWNERRLFTIQTPWAIFTDMAILTMNAAQEETNNMITSFEVTFKKIRFAKSQTTTATFEASKAAAQSASPANTGTTAGTASNAGALASGITAAESGG